MHMKLKSLNLIFSTRVLDYLLTKYILKVRQVWLSFSLYCRDSILLRHFIFAVNLGNYFIHFFSRWGLRWHAMDKKWVYCDRIYAWILDTVFLQVKQRLWKDTGVIWFLTLCGDFVQIYFTCCLVSFCIISLNIQVFLCNIGPKHLLYGWQISIKT